MNTTQQAEAARDRGMELSEANANRAKERWSEDAEATVIRYCLYRASYPEKDFLTEDVREWGEVLGMVDAPLNAKAWGGVMRRCAANGIIRKVGYAPSKSSNMSPKVLWRAV